MTELSAWMDPLTARIRILSPARRWRRRFFSSFAAFSFSPNPTLTQSSTCTSICLLVKVPLFWWERESDCSNFLFLEGSPHIGRGSVTEGKNVLKIKILSWQQKVQKVQKKGDCKSTTTIQVRRNQDQRKLRRGSPRPRWRTRWWRSRRTRRRTRRSALRWRGRWTTSPLSLAAPTTSLLVKIVHSVWVALLEPPPGI